jgi:nucleotide-sensitive chloride channel 1A
VLQQFDVDHLEFELNLGTDAMYVFAHSIGMGWRVSYELVVMHAIQRNPVSLYLQLQLGDGEVTDDEGDNPMAEIVFVPLNHDEIDDMFMGMTECAALHPLIQHDDEVVDFIGEIEDGLR